MEDGYDTLGLFLDHWNNTLQYSGLLLARAHAQNPNSKYREYTLFSATNFDARKGVTGAMADINAAYQYISEFPDGPFISEVYELLATFYDDFYKSLRHFMYGKVYEEDVQLACFEAYMTRQPYGVQATQIQVLAHHFYEKALSTAGEDARWKATIEEEFENFQEMTHAVEKRNYERWYWCGEC